MIKENSINIKTHVLNKIVKKYEVYLENLNNIVNETLISLKNNDEDIIFYNELNERKITTKYLETSKRIKRRLRLDIKSRKILLKELSNTYKEIIVVQERLEVNKNKLNELKQENKENKGEKDE